MHPSHYLSLHLPRRPKLGWKGRTLVSLLTLLTLYIVGFAAFIVLLPQPFTTVPTGLHGLAVFTGGSGRVDATLTLLRHGFTGPILISGIHPQTRLKDILTSTNQPLELTNAQRQQISLDTAQTTLENIRSLQAWAHANGLQQVGVVTSTYHTARVWLLGRWHTPQLTLTLLPVQPAGAGLKLLFWEYNKLLAAPFLR